MENLNIIAKILEMSANLVTAVGGGLIVWQICSNTKLNKINLTFQKISEMDAMLNDPGKLEIIQKIHLKNDDVAALNQGEAEVVFAYSEENRQVIFDILNFYEMLSAAIINRHLDEETMRQIAGYRIFTAYKKLSPFIVICQRYNDGDNRPYQHYEELYTEWKRYYSGREDPAR